MQLTEHFSLEELTFSQTAARNGIDNSLPEELRLHIVTLANGLEEIRAKVLNELPIIVTSGYRCLTLNRIEKGARDSRHMLALAADIHCPSFGTPLDVCRAIAKSGIVTDQIIHEYGQWCHVAFAAPGQIARNQLLTISHPENVYQEGLLQI